VSRRSFLAKGGIGIAIALVQTALMCYIANMKNIQVEKNASETNVNLLRRFTKRVQGSGVLSKVRSLRYATRKQSPYNVKKKALKNLRRKEEIAELIKQGKMSEKPGRR